MAERKIQSPHAKSLRRNGAVGVVVVAALFGGLGSWGALAEVSGAVVSGGAIVVDGKVKTIQHQEGGIVKAILVEDGDAVTAGQVLVRLDDTSIAAQLATLHTQLVGAVARQMRLEAEAAGRDELWFYTPTDLVGDPDLAAAIVQQQALMEARRTTREGQIAQLKSQMDQQDIQKQGLLRQKAALEAQYALLQEDMSNLDALKGQGLVAGNRVTAGRRDISSVDGELGQVEAAIAAADAANLERQMRISSISDTFNSDTLDELQTVRDTVAQTRSTLVAAHDRLARLEIRAPQGGIVNNSAVHTVGGVVGAGEALMQIVPQNDTMTVELQISPLDVDRIMAGQQASIRFPGLNMRTLPELKAQIISVSPDLTIDEQRGARYYTARAEFEAGELGRIGMEQRLLPGMPVEAFVTLEERTVLAYIVEPIMDQLNRAMREN